MSAPLSTTHTGPRLWLSLWDSTIVTTAKESEAVRVTVQKHGDKVALQMRGPHNRVVPHNGKLLVGIRLVIYKDGDSLVKRLYHKERVAEGFHLRLEMTAKELADHGVRYLGITEDGWPTLSKTPVKWQEPADFAVPAAAVAASKEVDGEFDMLDGELRFVRNGNVYEVDALTEKVGCFMGRKTAEGTIDMDAEEVGVEEEKAPESDLDVATAAVLKAATAVKAENASLKAELASLKAENASLKAENASLKAELASLKAELASLKAGLAKLCA